MDSLWESRGSHQILLGQTVHNLSDLRGKNWGHGERLSAGTKIILAACPAPYTSLTRHEPMSSCGSHQRWGVWWGRWGVHVTPVSVSRHGQLLPLVSKQGFFKIKNSWEEWHRKCSNRLMFFIATMDEEKKRVLQGEGKFAQPVHMCL